MTFKIPTSTPTGRRGANASRPNLASLNTGNVNHNGQCACWDLVVPALNLLQPLEIALANTCLYHRNYFSRRINLERTHRCNCHYQPDEYRCLDCGYCHLCGCDLVTTSTEHFHRCTCNYCLARCCPHRPLYHSARQAQRRHALLRELQKSERCPPGTPPNTTERRPEEPYPLEVVETLRLLDSSVKGRGRGILNEDDKDITFTINSRWPSDVYGTTVTEDRGATGLLRITSRGSRSNLRSPGAASQSVPISSLLANLGRKEQSPATATTTETPSASGQTEQDRSATPWSPDQSTQTRSDADQ